MPFLGSLGILILKAPITTAADDIHIFFIVFSGKKRLDVSSESSARQRIHMKKQALFSSKDKRIKLKCRLLHFFFSALRVSWLNRCVLCIANNKISMISHRSANSI